MHFYMWFSKDRIGSYKPVMQEPEASTKQGAQAVQHILLVPSDESQKTVSVGWVNRAADQAMIRSFSCLQTVHEQRHGSAANVDEPSYAQFMEKLGSFLNEEKMVFTIEETATAADGCDTAAVEYDEGAERKRTMVLAIVAVVSALAIIAVIVALSFLG